MFNLFKCFVKGAQSRVIFKAGRRQQVSQCDSFYFLLVFCFTCQLSRCLITLPRCLSCLIWNIFIFLCWQGVLPSSHISDRSRSTVAYLKQAHQYFTELHPVSDERTIWELGLWLGLVTGGHRVIFIVSRAVSARKYVCLVSRTQTQHTPLITELYGWSQASETSPVIKRISPSINLVTLTLLIGFSEELHT